MTSPDVSAARANKPLILGLVGAGALVVGAFLPWEKGDIPLLGTVTRSGIDSAVQGGRYGWVCVALGTLAAVSLFAAKEATADLDGFLTALVGVVAAGVAIYELRKVQRHIDKVASEALLTIGLGLWLVLAGAVAVAASGVWSIVTSRAERRGLGPV